MKKLIIILMAVLLCNTGFTQITQQEVREITAIEIAKEFTERTDGDIFTIDEREKIITIKLPSYFTYTLTKMAVSSWIKEYDDLSYVVYWYEVEEISKGTVINVGAIGEFIIAHINLDGESYLTIGWEDI